MVANNFFSQFREIHHQKSLHSGFDTLFNSISCSEQGLLTSSKLLYANFCCANANSLRVLSGTSTNFNILASALLDFVYVT